MASALACLLFATAAAAAASRPPAVAGSFYPADPAELSRAVDAALAAAPETKELDGPVVAVLVPHAGYAYSAAVAARAYRAVADAYDVVAVLGSAHHVAVGGAALDTRPYASPLGAVPLDEAAAEALLKDPLFQDLPEAHDREHSVETQIPFLQRRLKPGFHLLPLVMNTTDFDVARRVGTALARALAGRRALIVLSSDLSHYPQAETAEKVDRSTLRALQSLDPEAFWRTQKAMMARGESGLVCAYCGQSAVLAGLTAARALGADRARLLEYTHSGRVPGGDPGRVVGYAAMAFTRAGGGVPESAPLPNESRRALLERARRAVAEALDGRRPPAALSEDPDLNQPAAVFVTLTASGALRGCIGGTEPRLPLADAVADAALSAAFADRRFPPVTREELPALRFEISILGALRRAAGPGGVREGRDGVVLSRDGRGGLFLPSVWEQLPRKDDFLSELCAQKAGLPRDCWKDPATELRVFAVESFAEPR